MNKKYLDKLPGLILLILIIVGSIFRLYQISDQSYWIDEAYSINGSQAIMEHGYPKLASGEFYSNSLLNTYVITFFSLIFGQNELGYRFGSALFGITMILLVYLLSSRLLKSNIAALLPTCLITFSTWEILWSRQARGYMLLQFLYLLGFYFLYRLLEKWNKRDFYLFLICALLAFSSHFLGILLLPLGLAALAIKYRHVFSWEKIKKQRQWLLILVAIVGVSVILLLPKISQLVVKISHLQNPQILNYFSFLVMNHFFITMSALVGLAILIILQKNNNHTIFFVFSLLIPFLAVFAFTDYLQFRYVFFLYPLMVLLSSLTIWNATSSLKMKSLRIGILLVLTIVPNFAVLTFAPQSHYSLEPLTPQPDFKSAYQIINQNKNEDDIIISPYTPIDKIYFGQSDYWLMISLTGIPTELKRYENNPYDFYNASPLISGLSDLETLASEKNGFLVLDQLALNRLGNNFYRTILAKYQLIYHKNDGNLSRIWVFRF